MKLNALDIPLPNNSVNIVIARALFAHISGYKTVIKEIRRVLNNQGKLLIITGRSDFKKPDYISEVWKKHAELVKEYGQKICTRLGPSQTELFDYIESINGEVNFPQKWSIIDVEKNLRKTLYELENRLHPSLRLIEPQKNSRIISGLKEFLLGKYGEDYINLKTKSKVKQGIIEIKFTKGL